MMIPNDVFDEIEDNPQKALRRLRTLVKVQGARKTKQNQAKCGNSWLRVPPENLLRRMEEEFYEFRQAVEHNGTLPDAMEELADMLNFGLMFVIREYQEGLKETGSTVLDNLEGSEK